MSRQARRLLRPLVRRLLPGAPAARFRVLRFDRWTYRDG
jgi:hypothetical protein